MRFRWLKARKTNELNDDGESFSPIRQVTDGEVVTRHRIANNDAVTNASSPVFQAF
jgi:hypothetical protein